MLEVVERWELRVRGCGRVFRELSNELKSALRERGGRRGARRRGSAVFGCKEAPLTILSPPTRRYTLRTLSPLSISVRARKPGRDEDGGGDDSVRASRNELASAAVSSNGHEQNV